MIPLLTIGVCMRSTDALRWSVSWRLQDTRGDGCGIIARSIGNISREVQSPAEWAAFKLD